ncbi:myoneurin-like isoform X2 [Cheilinus undulatus]|uniref:myoneurin-like isoform X2 n=1 Tax=Cheilinus undulatus TaxID=241271 RepID=UPI001BD4140D|nr:myoneurin-like isoform X2 [Cheilinus undulatus]
MSEGDSLRELVTERLTAAAEDIFKLVKTTIVEYKEELERQRKRLDIFLSPKIYLHRTDEPHQLVCKEEESLSNREKNSSPDQEEAEPPRVKEEPEEPCSIQEGEQLELKEETETFMLTPAHEERNHSEPELHEQQFFSSLRELITERQKAAAEDIFELVQTTIVEYKEELEHQRKQLDIFLNPAVYLHRIDVPQQLVCKEEEVVLSKQLCYQDRNSSPDQEEAEPPRMKEEPEEPCSIQEGEQLELKEETDWFMTPAHEERDHSEPELHEQQLLSDSTHVSEDQDPAGSKDKDSESSRNSEPNIPDKIHQSSHNTDVSENQWRFIHQTKMLDFWISVVFSSRHYKGLTYYVPQQLVCKEEEVLLSEQLCNQDRNSSPHQEEAEPPWIKEEPEEPCSIQEGEQQVFNARLEDEPQQLVCEEEEVLSDREKSSSPDQEEAEPPQIKEEQEEPCSIQEGEQLELKEETDAFMLTPAHEERDHSEPELHEHQLLSQNSHVAEDQDPAGSKDRGSESIRNSEPNPPNRIYQSRHNTDMSENQCGPLQDKPSFKCGICGECVKNKLALKSHQRVHSGKETQSCKICGKMFIWKSLLRAHVRSHTGEKPFTCTTCGKGFIQMSHLKNHNMIHTGEKTFTCTTCGKSFTQQKYLKFHIRTHT